MKESTGFIVTIEKDTDGTFVAYNTDDNHYVVIGRGDTVEEAKKDFFNSMAEMAECEVAAKGEAAAVLTATPSFSLDIPSLLDYYKVFNMTELAKYLGVNPSLLRHYKKGDTAISAEQTKKIETGLHRLAGELSALQLL